MKKISILIALVISLLICPLSASAQKSSIYSWTDENGVKHFSDTAPANIEASSQEIMDSKEAMAVDEYDTGDTLNNYAVDSVDGTSSDPSAEPLSYADQQRQAMAERREAEKKKQADRNRICLQARDQLARIEPSRRVFYTDENGDTTRLDDDQRVKMVEESKNLVAEYCD